MKNLSGRRFGKNNEAYLEFVNACEQGKRALYVGLDYVAMPVTYYTQLQSVVEAAKELVVAHDSGGTTNQAYPELKKALAPFMGTEGGK